MKFALTLLNLIACFCTLPAQAQTSFSGKIVKVQIADDAMQLRVFLDVTMSNCNLNFAFIEPTSSTYATYAAAIMTAYTQSKNVSIQVNRETTGYCRIYFLEY